ncbi:hypothetical protein [Cardinium endosymbiont of Nabis limbatus]|uniref:hypothetical protein n=1 Tax=Cardinium endosymbiont of Nabis limbatus TaxID=3066217 RepID=UPI003AF395E3
MASALLTLLAWDKWMSLIVGATSGTFVSILTNGLVMLAAHYLLLQPKPKVQTYKKLDDDLFKQIQ